MMSDELEIIKLKNMLEEAKIPFKYTNHAFGGQAPAYQITINSKETNDYLCDAIYHFASYGYNMGKLEIMGALTIEESEHNTVLGYLTAEEVFKRFKYCYEHNTSVYEE